MRIGKSFVTKFQLDIGVREQPVQLFTFNDKESKWT